VSSVDLPSRLSDFHAPRVTRDRQSACPQINRPCSWPGYGSSYTRGTQRSAAAGDKRKEKDETFFVNLSGPSNATIADGQGRCTIVNDD
jgi:hypothetical protein